MKKIIFSVFTLVIMSITFISCGSKPIDNTEKQNDSIVVEDTCISDTITIDTLNVDSVN